MTMTNPSNKKLFSVTGLVFTAILLVAVNFLVGLVFKGAHLDLTENQLYTLSEGSHNILENLEEPITLRFYFSRKLAVNVPQVTNYADRVQDLLESYSELAKGKINLRIYDPEPFSEEEDQAVQYQLQGVPVDTAGSLLYFGLVGTNSTDSQEIIAFFQDDKEESLEYDLTRLVYNLSHPQKQTVGLMSTLPLDQPKNPMMLGMSGRNEAWVISDVIRQSFTMLPVGLDVEAIPDNIDILMIVHPKNLADQTLYAIDQFVLKGGKALVFVDPYSEADNPEPDPQNPMAALTAPRNSNMAKLLEQWGLELSSNEFAGDIDSATRVTVNSGNRPQSIEYLAWLTLGPERFNNTDFVTKGLQQLNLATSGILKKKDNSTMTVTPLIETSAKAMAMDLNQIQFGPNPAALLSNYRAGSEQLMLAARVHGKASSAFPAGRPDGKESKSHITASPEPVNVIVVADTDMLSDKFWVSVQNFFGQRVAVPRSGNGTFVVNALENLSGSNDLISLRSRGKSSRPFVKVQELQVEAEKRFLDKEKTLRTKLQDTERKINELQSLKKDGSSMLLSAEQQREIESFRDEQVKTRKELRHVQHELRSSIESLGSTLKLINIGLLPVIILLLALAVNYFRQRRHV